MIKVAPIKIHISTKALSEEPERNFKIEISNGKSRIGKNLHRKSRYDKF